MKTDLLKQAIKAAELYPSEFRCLGYSSQRKTFLQRARRSYRRCLADPGDCAGDEALLAGLAVAEAEIGRGPGWIPEVQRLGVLIAKELEKKEVAE